MHFSFLSILFLHLYGIFIVIINQNNVTDWSVLHNKKTSNWTENVDFLFKYKKRTGFHVTHDLKQEIHILCLYG